MTNGDSCGCRVFANRNAREFTAPQAPHCHSSIRSRAVIRPCTPYGEFLAIFQICGQASPHSRACGAASRAVADVPLTVEALGQQLREVLPARRLQSVSLCDHEANVLWLSEGALGPDEHSLVTEALMLLTADPSLPSHEIALEDGRLALFLPVRAPNGQPVGIAMILADRKSVGDDTLERITRRSGARHHAAPGGAAEADRAHVGSGTPSIPVLDFDEAQPRSPGRVAAAPAPRAAAAAPRGDARGGIGRRHGHLGRGDRRHPRVRACSELTAGGRAAPRSSPLRGPCAARGARGRDRAGRWQIRATS